MYTSVLSAHVKVVVYCLPVQSQADIVNRVIDKLYPVHDMPALQAPRENDHFLLAIQHRKSDLISALTSCLRFWLRVRTALKNTRS